MKLKPFQMNGSLKLCCGCGQPFPIRGGNIEVQVGLDGQLYCYAGPPQCTALAVEVVALRSAA